MNLLSQPDTKAIAVFLRKAGAVLVLMAYLFAGVLHGICEADASSSNGSGAVFSLVKKNLDSTHKGVAADRHCHGCFQVSMPAPAGPVVLSEITARVPIVQQSRPLEWTQVVDPPPRKT